MSITGFVVYVLSVFAAIVGIAAIIGGCIYIRTVVFEKRRTDER